MEEQLKRAFEIADYMSVLSSQKNILKEEYAQNLCYYHNGGSFTLTKDLITFVKLLLDSNQLENVVLIDNNNIPVNIENLKDFFEKILSLHTQAANLYYTKYNLLIKNRKVESLIDIDD